MISKDLSDYYNSEPNFSVFLPGECNAKCEFCYNQPQTNKVSYADYLKNLEDIFAELPKFCNTISITGYEPTLSPILSNVLRLTDEYDFDRVVLNTNGTAIFSCVNSIHLYVDYINLSRHHYIDAVNKRIFGGSYNLTTEDIQMMCDEFNSMITLTSIVTPQTPYNFIDSYIDYALSLGVENVLFRQIAGNPEFLYIFDKQPYTGFTMDKYCRYRTGERYGMKYTFKSSVINPGLLCGKIYEYIYKPDGKLYTQW